MSSSFSTESEEVFARYLAERGLTFDYELAAGTKHPDFWVRHRSGTVVCEVTEITSHILPTIAGSYDPYEAVRAKINEKAKQARHLKGVHPFVIVVRSQVPHPPPEMMIPGAMFGDEGFEMPFDPATGAARLDERSATFLRGGRLQPERNTRVSAVAMLTTFNPTYLGAKADIDRRLAGRDSLDDYVAASQEVFWDQAHFRDEHVPRLDVFHNVYAAEPRLDRLVFRGPHDRHWDCVEGCYERTWKGPEFDAAVGKL